MLKKILILGIFIFFLSGCDSERKDIKDNFCGVHINFQYCKCAFHDEHCAAIKMDSEEAEDYVYEKYDEWNDNK